MISLRGRTLLMLAILGLVFTGFPRTLHVTQASVTIPYNPVPMAVFPGTDQLGPAALQASDGTLWLAFQSDLNGNMSGGRTDIFYQTTANGTWTLPQNLTGMSWNIAPALAQLKNSTILAFWASNNTARVFNLYYERLVNPLFGFWSARSQLTFGTASNDTAPTAAVGRDGTLWLTWTRVTTICSTTCTVSEQLYYRTLKNGVWSSEAPLTSDSNWNWGSSVLVGKDGIVRVAWSKGQSSLNNFQIWFKSYNGVAWSAESRIVSSTMVDDHPSLLQDRNGTYWVFWGRQVPNTTCPGCFQYVMFDKSSADGIQWPTSETQVTFDTTLSHDSKMPVAVQANMLLAPTKPYARSIWVFYSTNPNRNFDIYALQSSPVSPVHDVAVSSITAVPGTGTSWTITVKVSDLGDYAETVSVGLTLSNATSYKLGPLPGSVAIGGSTSIVFNWISGVAPFGSYSATASVAPVLGESLGNQGDNSLLVGNLIQVLPSPVTSGGGGGGHTIRI